MQEGNIAQAQQIFAQISDGNRKMITAEGLNKINQAVTALQRFYSSDIEDYIEEKQTEWEALIDRFEYKGIYANGVLYHKNNYVKYTIDNKTKLYIAIDDPPLRIPPVNTTYWRVLTISGEKGDSGDGFVFAGGWNASQTYATQNAVNYNGYLWVALRPSTGQIPSESSTYWRRLESFAPETYPVSENPPITQSDNSLWFEII